MLFLSQPSTINVTVLLSANYVRHLTTEIVYELSNGDVTVMYLFGQLRGGGFMDATKTRGEMIE